MRGAGAGGARSSAKRTTAKVRGLLDDDQRFRILIDSVKDYAIFMLDAGGRVQTWNAGAELLKGYRPDEIIGRSIETFYDDEDRRRGLPRRLLDEAARAGRVENQGWRVRKDGSCFWADVVITAVHDAAGELIGFVKVTRDLTVQYRADEQRQRQAEELRRSEERFRLLVDAVEDYAIFMLDPAGHVTTWNAGAQRIEGYRASEIIGQHFSRFRPEEDVRAGRCEQELQAAAHHGRVEEEGWRLRKDGSRFWANVVLTALRSPSGALLGFVKITRDLTERRRLEEERLQRARAEEAIRMRDDFLSMVSHELRTPLTALRIELHGWQERLGLDDERSVKRFGRAVRNVDRLTALIESLLDVSRIATGRMVLKPERIDLSQAVAELVETMRAPAEKFHCQLEFSTTGPVPGRWDRLRIEQVVMSLVGNAFKYGAGQPVAVSVSRDHDHAIIEVADHGPGIAESDLARIFGRFERAASTRHYGGLGLGLYVSREIVEAEGGSITARNRAAGGACFTVRLPIQTGTQAAHPANTNLAAG